MSVKKRKKNADSLLGLKDQLLENCIGCGGCDCKPQEYDDAVRGTLGERDRFLRNIVRRSIKRILRRSQILS